jgi:hypothetical protein
MGSFLKQDIVLALFLRLYPDCEPVLAGREVHGGETGTNPRCPN